MTPTEPDAGPPAPQGGEGLTSPDRGLFPIVGIGASAGGIDALRDLLPALDPHAGLAFIIVLHLDPGHESALAAVLSRFSPIPVIQIEDGMAVQPGHVYVIPSNAILRLHEGHMHLSCPATPAEYRNGIDEFFISLADDAAENAACIILSGTGSDGTQGLRAVKEHGGLSIAQANAEYDGMMRSAVATGLVDFVLPATDIPEKLAGYFGNVNCEERQKAHERIKAEAADQLSQILALLRQQTGHDLSGYKDRTIIRRVQRRMNVLQIDDVPGFIARLQRDPHEVRLLFQDLLIGVTNFFRDPPAFAALEHEVIPALFKDKTPDRTIRVWVPGCSTGEEAYSIAMLLRDAAAKTTAPPRLQIFASDIDEHALEIARIGRYPDAISKDVPSDRLERYFVREDGSYRITSDLREICLFSSHNMLRDAPFSKLDLISCRNLLIYLSSDLQDRVIPLFHYALNPDGYLFLGTSENVTRHSRLFTTVDKAHRIFRRRGHMERLIPEFPLSTPESPGHRQHVSQRAGMAEPSLKGMADRQLLERFAPAYVVINAEGDVLQSSGRTGKYLELPPGAPDTNIFSMARPGLRLDLRAVLHKAVGSRQLAVQRRVVIGVNGGRQEIDLYVQPLHLAQSPDSLYMIVFQDIGAVRPMVEIEALAAEDNVEEANVRQLETELRATKERLQTTTEELESSNEELKSSNEELQSINEELQSTNEELETSKEELQSINEELQTVNMELHARVEELSRANNDISNLLESTQIATVFLDRQLFVKSFTPAAKDVFHLVESDAGRPIMHVRPRIHLDTLQEDVERVLRTLGTVEKPVAGIDNDRRYILRILPYRTTDNVINGVVLTFTDITLMTAAEARIKQLTAASRARLNELETLLDLVLVGVMIADADTSKPVPVNTCGARLIGQAVRQKGLMPLSVPVHLFHDEKELAPDDLPWQRSARTGELMPDWQGRLQSNANGKNVHVMVSATPLLAEGGQVTGAIAAIVDISAHKRAEEQQQLLLHELQHRVKNIVATISSLATRMARRHRTVDEFEAAFLARLRAMGRTHDLLATAAWSSTSLRSLIEAAVEPFVDPHRSNVRLSGDNVLLAANSAATMGMVLHELATNAAKYGALSAPDGHVDVAWQRTGDGHNRRLSVTWTERGGPPVNPASKPGFGSGFITRSVAYELSGTAAIVFEPEGLRCTMDLPLAGNVEDATSEGH